MKRAKKIYDCFLFDNEVDLLELRLRQAYEKVDHFVICEATVTFHGKPKRLSFRDHRQRFQPFLDKIIHVVADDLPASESAGDREHFHRNCLKRGLAGLRAPDVAIVSDCDEIISSQTLDYLRSHDGYFVLDMPMYQYYMNLCALKSGWCKPFAYSGALHSRIGDYGHLRGDPAAARLRFVGEARVVERAGWHFNFLGGADPGGGDSTLEFCEIDASFPEAVVANLDHFVAAGYVKTRFDRIKELEKRSSSNENALRHIGHAQRYQSAALEYVQTLDSSGTVDLALNRPATQSSIAPWSIGKTVEEDARRCNSGKIHNGPGCQTAKERNPWWEVDLGAAFVLSAVWLYNCPGPRAQRLRHFTLLGSLDRESWRALFQKTDDDTFGREELAPLMIVPAPQQPTRFVRLRLDAEDYLHFDACLVFGQPVA